MTNVWGFQPIESTKCDRCAEVECICGDSAFEQWIIEELDEQRSRNVESPIDHTIRIVDGFLANMPVHMGCNRDVILAMNGYGKTPECPRLAQVGLVELELQFCFECQDEFDRGKLESYR
jgi:hypothetical protein